MSISRIRGAAIIAGSLAALAVPVAASASTDGSVTVSLTKPIIVTATHEAAVACTVDGSRYDATLATTIRNYRVVVDDAVSDYEGPGTYASNVRVTVDYLPTDAIHTENRSVNVQIGSSGESGSVPFSHTFTGEFVPRFANRSVAGTIGWSCES